ncbi:hypothetical protein COU53_01885 [Candidatus Pacearchaeota archaeon CG10_big_fil_rev_8_21_14_0_10_30_48]|nr:MAG: hypothetical protein COU53_01885 [Candidatus Pacearchaeota archaeon CG10_big_fil_rev_8_21_14_0_10_30_48]
MAEDKIEYEEETPEVEVDLMEDEQKEEVEKVNSNTEKIANIPDKIDKIQDEKIRGRIIVFNPKESEFAKNLNLVKAGDYIEKK